MFQPQILSTRFEVAPKCLAKDWQLRFLETLKKLKTRTITPMSGAILEVQKIESLEPPKIHNGKIVVSCRYSAIVFHPSVGEVYKGKITLVMPRGLLIEAEGMVKVLIQPNNLPDGYKYDAARKAFINGVHSYEVDDSISFKITSLRFKPGGIDCMASAKEVVGNQREEDHEENEYEAPLEPDDNFVD